MRPGLGARRESWAGRWYLLPPLKFLPLTSWHYTQSYARAQTPDHPCVSVRLPRPSIRLRASCGEDADGFSHLSQLERRRYVFDLICFMDSGRAPPRSGRCSPDNSGPLALRSQFMYLGRWGECAHTARGWRDERHSPCANIQETAFSFIGSLLLDTFACFHNSCHKRPCQHYLQPLTMF